jgi:hypothetical protein
MAFRTSRTFDAIFIAALALLLWWSWVNRVAVGDWVFFLSYHPSPEAVQVASDAGLSAYGRKLFYRTDPQFESRAQVEAACSIEQLGCIDEKGRVYILDDTGKHDQAIVTAAHEMLHLAYRRLPQADKDALAADIDLAVAANAENGIQDELAGEKTDDGRRDEAHSLLGTEYKDLPASLDRYYSRYFSDRSKVLDAEAASLRQ